jgi:N-acyl-D-aspartate/D-glutamate deacylase
MDACSTAKNPWILADVAIRMVALRRSASWPRVDERNAAGKYVSPGWIDMMDQSGSVLPRNGRAENKLQEGVTTAIGGEGGTPVPAARVAEYFATLERQGISINFGSYFSETQARTAVLGMSARQPTAAELVRMRAIVDTAMRGGAMGMTTALIYPPSSYSTTDELVEVAKPPQNGGVCKSHSRRGKRLSIGARRRSRSAARRYASRGVSSQVADRPSWGI